MILKTKSIDVLKNILKSWKTFIYTTMSQSCEIQSPNEYPLFIEIHLNWNIVYCKGTLLTECCF